MACKLIGDSIGLHPLYAAVADPRDDPKDAEIERNGNVEPKPILSSKKIRDAEENCLDEKKIVSKTLCNKPKGNNVQVKSLGKLLGGCNLPTRANTCMTAQSKIICVPHKEGQFSRRFQLSPPQIRGID